MRPAAPPVHPRLGFSLPCRDPRPERHRRAPAGVERSRALRERHGTGKRSRAMRSRAGHPPRPRRGAECLVTPAVRPKGERGYRSVPPGRWRPGLERRPRPYRRHRRRLIAGRRPGDRNRPCAANPADVLHPAMDEAAIDQCVGRCMAVRCAHEAHGRQFQGRMEQRVVGRRDRATEFGVDRRRAGCQGARPAATHGDRARVRASQSSRDRKRTIG